MTDVLRTQKKHVRLQDRIWVLELAQTSLSVLQLQKVAMPSPAKVMFFSGKVFFGKDSSTSDMAAPVDQAIGQFRPLGHDCKSTNYLTNYTNKIYYSIHTFYEF